MFVRPTPPGNSHHAEMRRSRLIRISSRPRSRNAIRSPVGRRLHGSQSRELLLSARRPRSRRATIERSVTSVTPATTISPLRGNSAPMALQRGPGHQPATDGADGLGRTGLSGLLAPGFSPSLPLLTRHQKWVAGGPERAVVFQQKVNAQFTRVWWRRIAVSERTWKSARSSSSLGRCVTGRRARPPGRRRAAGPRM